MVSTTLAAITTAAEVMPLIILLLGIIALSIWSKDVFFQIIAALVTLFIALRWSHTYTDLSIVFFGLGLYELTLVVMNPFLVPEKEGRIKSWFHRLIGRG